MKIAIIGAGIVGRLLAWHCCELGYEVHLFEQGSFKGEKSCSLLAAGMISPFAELPVLSPVWYKLARQAIPIWRKVLATLNKPVNFTATGSLVVALKSEMALLNHFLAILHHKQNEHIFSELTSDELAKLNLDSSYLTGCFLKDEAAIDVPMLFTALNDYFFTKGVKCYEYTLVQAFTAFKVFADGVTLQVDKVFDCRGLGAKNTFPHLRGVKGEIVVCQNKGIALNYPVRLLHSRFPCYIVPRKDAHFIIGATQIEEEYSQHVSVRSALELFSAALNVDIKFNDANIIQMYAAHRPTTLAHHPQVLNQQGIIAINGMARHGFLLAPALTAKIAKGEWDATYA